MTRDELIDELKKCPKDSEIEVLAEIHTECGTCGDSDIDVCNFKIEGVDQIPVLRIRLYDKRFL